MKRKRKSSTGKSAHTKQKATHIHFFYVIAAVWIAGTAVAYHLVTTKDTAVLNASTQLGRNAGGGTVMIGDIDDEGEVEIEIDASGGIEIEDESGSSGSQATSRKANRRLQKIRAKIERKASRSAKPREEKQERKKDKKEKVLVLPQAAVEALLKNGIITAMPVTGTTSATEDLDVIYTRVKGSPAFILIGSKEEKLFGVIPVSVKKEVTVSAENGEVVEAKQSLAQRIIDLFSF